MDGTLFRRVEAEDAYTTGLIEIHPDGRTLWWLDSKGRDRAAVVAQDLVSGQFRELAADPLADLGKPILDPVSCVPIAAPAVYERRRWHTLDATAAADLDRLRASGEGDLTWFGLSNDRSQWIGYAEPRGMPGRYFHYQRASGKVKPLFSTRPTLEKMPLVPLEPVIITSRDGLKLVSYLSRPRDAVPGRSGPTVLFVHGGP
jgi:hypothetical protein